MTKRTLALLLFCVGCGQSRPEPLASLDELHWLGKTWTDPHILADGTLYTYRLEDWPTVEVQLFLDQDGGGYTIHTMGWSNEKQEWVEHGPELTVREENCIANTYHLGRMATGRELVIIPISQGPLRVEDPDEYGQPPLPWRFPWWLAMAVTLIAGGYLIYRRRRSQL